MEISYIKDGNKNLMIVKGISIDENDYRLQMVIKNHIDGIVPLMMEQMNNEYLIKYNVSSKIRLSDLFARKQMSGKELYCFIKDLKILSEKISEYLLNINNIVFDVELIFFNRQTGKYEFCYIPEEHGEFQLKIRDLFDKLLEYIDHNDKEVVQIAYGVQQLTLAMDFTLHDILQCACENMKKLKEKEQEQSKTDTKIKVNIPDEQHKKKGILETIQIWLGKKNKYKTTDEIEEDNYLKEYLEEDEMLVMAEEEEPYNQREDRTMLLTNQFVTPSLVLKAIGTETPIEVKPAEFPYIIGKSEYSCNFCIDSAVVSRVHMRIVEELNDFYVEDLNSTNGTFINGEKISSHNLEPIHTGDKLTIANIDFIVE